MIKELGKISSVKFGFISDYPFLFGLQLTFQGKGWGIGCGGKYTINMKEIDNDTKFTIEEQKDFLHKAMKDVIKILNDAKVNNVYDLVNKPVEVILNNDDNFDSFRILSEVL